MEYIQMVFLASVVITTYILSVLGIAILIVQHKVENVEDRYNIKTMVVPIIISSLIMDIVCIIGMELLEALV